VKPAPAVAPQGAAEALGGALRFLSILLRLLAVGVLLLAVRTGCYSVEAGKQALPFHFGKIVGDAPVEGGDGRMHWILPRPFGRVVLLPSSSAPQNLVSSSFWPAEANSALVIKSDESTDSTEHLVMGRDGCLLTGDAYLFHVRGNLTWNISDAAAYWQAFGNNEGDVVKTGKQAESILRQVLDSALLGEAAKRKVDDAFYTDLNGYRLAVTRNLSDRLQTQKFGITVSRLEIKSEDRRAIRLVQGTFNNVVAAQSNASSRINAAKKQALEIAGQADAESRRILADAAVYRENMMVSTENKARKMESFLKVYDPRNPEASLASLYLSTLGESLAAVQEKYLIKKGDNQELRLQLSRLSKAKTEPMKP
jgi:regulator of protease activity HflC (stomatin/prohibitin superfamily)